MPGGPWQGGLVLALGGIVYDLFLAALRRVDHAFPSTDPAESAWWFGYARDGANLLGFLMFASAFVVLGLPPPLALLAGGLWSMLAYGVDYLCARALTLRHPHIIVGAALAAGAGLAAALRAPIAAGLGGLAEALF
jgi:hypothetical protein